LLIYLDSCIVIYLIEQPAGFGPRASSYVSSRLAAGDRLVVSDLTRLECRTQPLAVGDAVTLGHYDQFFAGAVEPIMPLSTAVLDRATEVRSQYRFKTPDAIHLAAAEVGGCQVFLTNDTRLSRFTAITVEVLP
jgi:predicted nucleic acid-binding protein